MNGPSAQTQYFQIKRAENIGNMKFIVAFVFTLRWKMYTAEVISFDFMVPVRSLKVHLNEH